MITVAISLLAMAWITVLWAGLAMVGVGLFLVTILNIAYTKLRVDADPTVEAIQAILPGVNCGGCGLAGCGAYAEAVAKDHGLMGRCCPGGAALVHQIAAILGIEAAASAPIRAIVHCGARREDKTNHTRYLGPSSCTEAQLIGGVQGCPYGCLGLGECERACPFDAIHVIDGVAKVNYAKCVGCGACVKVCPRELIELVPLKENPTLIIACSSLDPAKEVKSYCQVGCVGCGICAKLAPTVFQMRQNLAVIDYSKYNPRGEGFDKAREKCPRAAMVWVGTQTPAETPRTVVM